MTHRRVWEIEVRCKDGNHPPLTVEIAANSGLEALSSAVDDLVAEGAAHIGLDATWPDCVTVQDHASTPPGERFRVTCRCGADWGIQNRRLALNVLRDTIPNYHGPGLCEDRWPENRTPPSRRRSTVSVSQSGSAARLPGCPRRSSPRPPGCHRRRSRPRSGCWAG